MTYVITEPCVGVRDQSCVDVCPVDCIHAEAEDPNLYIDPDECIDCGACEPACPVSAIYSEDDVPGDQTPWIEINREWYQDKDSARGKVRDLIPDAAPPADLANPNP
jgi:NAD-dependent dihydropyrimidine dehydrogenase PreA subunit